MAKTPTDIRSLARAHTETCIKTLAGIVRQTDAPHSARVAAAQVLLDRGWGKATQHVEVTRRIAAELNDDELANIAAGSSEGIAQAPLDPTKLN